MNNDFYSKLKSEIEAKFEGISQNVADRLASKLAKSVTTEDQVKTAIDGLSWQSIIDSYADSRASEAARTAVENYEKRHKLKDGKPQEIPLPEPKPEPQGGEQQPEWVKALLKSNEALSARLEAIESDKIVSARRARLNSVVEKLPESLRKAYERTPVAELTNDDFDAMISEVSKEVETMIVDNAAKGAVFGKPSFNNLGGAPKELSKEQLEAIGKRDGAASNEQPF